MMASNGRGKRKRLKRTTAPELAAREPSQISLVEGSSDPRPAVSASPNAQRSDPQMQSTLRCPAGQAGTFVPRSARADCTPPAKVRREWHARHTPGRFSRGSGVSDAEVRVFLAVEGFASEGKPWCWPGIDALCEESDKAPRTLRTALTALEDTGWLRRVYGSQNELLGFVLLRRACTAATPADTPERQAQAEAALRGRKISRRPRASGAKSAADSGGLEAAGFGSANPVEPDDPGGRIRQPRAAESGRSL